MTDKGEKFMISLDIENIGPHFGDNKISFTNEAKSNKAIFFATNGTGKSFISRAFRLSVPSMANLSADDVLTIGKDSGRMKFCVQDNNPAKELEIEVHRGSAPTVKNNTGLLFHVFNNDYVEENIKGKIILRMERLKGTYLARYKLICLKTSREKRSLALK